MAKKNQDTKYLYRRRGSVWWFQIRVPDDLRELVKAKGGRIQKSLGTTNLREAQDRRWRVYTETQAWFDRLREERPLSEGEIVEEGEREFYSTYQDLRADRRARTYAANRLDAVLYADYSQIDEHEWVLDADSNWFKRARQVIENAGGVVEEKTVEKLAEVLASAHTEALEHFINRLEPPPPPDQPRPLRPRIGASDLRFSEAAGRYIADRQRDPAAAWTAQTLGQVEASARLFSGYVQDCALRDVSREDASGFLDTIGNLHHDYGRSSKTRDLSLDEILASYTAVNPEDRLKNRTLNRHATALSALFKWASERGLYEGENPFSGQRRKIPPKHVTRYLPYTIEELNHLFRTPPFTVPHKERVRPQTHSTRTALAWAPLLGLLTGQRSDELCGLRTADVREEGGITYLAVEAHEGRRVKTEAAIRGVPVHSELERCGFLKYVQHIRRQRHEYLFPGLKPGGPDGKRNWYFTKAFRELTRRAEITRERVVFHSFRVTLITALEEAGVAESDTAEVVGHERHTITYGLYSHGLSLERRKAVIEAASFPGLDLSHLYEENTYEENADT